MAERTPRCTGAKKKNVIRASNRCIQKNGNEGSDEMSQAALKSSRSWQGDVELEKKNVVLQRTVSDGLKPCFTDIFVCVAFW